jgi:hypothetical protein
MKKNLDTKGRLIRLGIAFVLLIYALWEKSWIAGAISLFVFYEALAGWCIYYHFIGKNDCSIDNKK